MKIDTEIIWAVFTLDHDESAAKVRFEERTGKKVEFVERDHNYLWVGAKEKSNEQDA